MTQLRYLPILLLAITSWTQNDWRSYYPVHSADRLCMGFTAAYCDYSYQDDSAMPLDNPVARQIYSDMVRSGHARLIFKFEGAVERWQYTICIGFTGRQCDEAHPVGSDLGETTNKAAKNVPAGVPFKVLLPVGVFDVAQPFYIVRGEHLIGGPTWFMDKRAHK